MVKVRILTGVTAASAAALALPSLVGCTADAQDSVDTGTDDNTASIAGSGQLVLHGWSLHYQSTSGGDEFLRVGERMKATVDHFQVTSMIAYSDNALLTDLRSDPSKLKMSLKLTYTKFDGSTYDAPLLPIAWKPGSSGIVAGSTDEFIVPKAVRALKMEYVAEFMKAGVPQTQSVLSSHGIQSDFVIFGAYVPNKLALFDTVGAERRTRVVEGGKIVQGAKATISVTDWRLDTVVDRVGLDLRVGQKNSGSRFGPVVVDALGSLEYEVTAAISTDGGATYNPVDLSKVMRPPIFSRADGFRFAHDKEIEIPSNAGPSMKVAFHVKAFLQVPNYYPGEIQNARYAPGSRILLKDVWDNNGGADYALPIGRE